MTKPKAKPRGDSGAAVAEVRGREILDSRGNPTVEAEIILACGVSASAAAPAGASTGKSEAAELRDGEKRMRGKGTRKAAANLCNEISATLSGMDSRAQEEIDGALSAANGGENTPRLGANAVVAASVAAAKAAAAFEGKPLYRYLAADNGGGQTMPAPFMNILNGGAHAENNLDFQEFMVAPLGFSDFKTALFAGAEVFHALKDILKQKGKAAAGGDEGGFAPDLRGAEEAFDLLSEASALAGLAPGKEIYFALDCAASGLFDGYVYRMPGEKFCGGAGAFVERLARWRAAYPLVSIEDGCAENDWEGWRLLTEKLGATTQIVGDDLFATDCGLLRRGVEERAANAVLIKPNQTGTLTGARGAVRLARDSGYAAMLSHRSGETEYADLADLAVAWDSGQIKTGAPCRGERTAKYNRLLRIAEELGGDAGYAGGVFLKGTK